MDKLTSNQKFAMYMVVLLLVGAVGAFVVVEKKKTAEAKAAQLLALAGLQDTTPETSK